MTAPWSLPDPVRSAVWQHVQSARWFGGKGRAASLGSILPLPWHVSPTADTPGVRSEIAEVRYADGQVEHYQLLLSYGVAPGWGRVEVPGHGPLEVGDALTDPDCRRRVWQSLAPGGRVIAEGSHHREELTTQVDAVAAGAAGVTEVSLFGGEQSNTSLLIGDRLLLKLFRKLEPGRNPDIELHRALAEAGNTDCAALHGSVEARWDDPDRHHDVDLAMIIEQFSGVRDGWELALAMCADGESFAWEAADLGAALRRVHQSLAAGGSTSELDGARIAEVLEGQLADATQAAPELTPYAAGLRSRFEVLRGRRIGVQRVHGDLHLGQVLHTRTGWKVIDFEGEPVKSMAQRRAADSPWRDVAGILRSFSYAAATVAGPDGAARAWAEEASDAFVAGYRVGARTDEDQCVLTAYVADRAAYEVAYETRNRPDWVHIPLTDVARLAARTAPRIADARRSEEDAP